MNNRQTVPYIEKLHIENLTVGRTEHRNLFSDSEETS